MRLSSAVVTQYLSKGCSLAGEGSTSSSCGIRLAGGGNPGGGAGLGELKRYMLRKQRSRVETQA